MYFFQSISLLYFYTVILKSIFYTFLNIFLNLKPVLYLASPYFLHSKKFIFIFILRRFLYCPQPNWRFFSFPSSERFLYRWQAYWFFFIFLFLRKILLPFTCFYLELFSVFLIIIICHFIIKKKIIKKYFISIFYML